MYSQIEKKKAVDLYIKYDKQLSKTIKTLGYPSSRTTLREWYYEFRDGYEFRVKYSWVNEKHPAQQKDCSYRRSLIEDTDEQKHLAVRALLLREKTAKEIADNIGVYEFVL